MMPSMRALLRPASVAIVGATPGAGRGGWIHEQLLRLGYAGPIYPVNPKYGEIRGAKAYPSLLDIPAPVEFVAVALGASQAIGVMEQCVQKQIRAALFVASGFAETGPAGWAIQDELRRLAVDHEIAVCGPNCYGIANIHGRFAAYGGSLTQPLRPGPIALLFQSGALTHAVMDPVAARSSGYSYIITTGNEAVVELADYVAAIADDPHTRVIACFVEGFKSPERFFAAARQAIGQGKRLVILKTGRSELAQRAALAHTGSLTGPDDVYDALFRQLGIARVADLDELIETAELLSLAAPAPAGAAAIVSISGGSCGVAADLAQGLGLALAPIGAPAAARLRAILPPFASAHNPLDLTGAIGEDPALLPGALAALAAEPQINAVALALNTPIGGDTPGQALYQAMCRAVAASAAASDTLHIVFSMSSGQYDPEVVRIMRAAGVPLLMGMRESLAALTHWQRCSAVTEMRDPAALAGPDLTLAAELVRRSAETTLSEHAAKAVLAAAGVPICREIAAATPDDAVQAAEQIGYPVALKIDSPDIPHKTEAGCVSLNLGSPQVVADAFQAVGDRARCYRPAARIDGVLVQEMVRGGVETLAGVVNHAGLGPVIVFGLGGVLVEALDDWAMRAAPIGEAEALALIAETRAARILAGWRGGPPLDIAALARALVQLGRLGWQLRDTIAAIDINPLVVLPCGQGVKVVDALIVRKEPLDIS
jgi:acyl-CoA synthetase (NDP forming)